MTKRTLINKEPQTAFFLDDDYIYTSAGWRVYKYDYNMKLVKKTGL